MIRCNRKDTKIDQSNEEDWNSAIVNGYPVNILLVAVSKDHTVSKSISLLINLVYSGPRRIRKGFNYSN